MSKLNIPVVYWHSGSQNYLTESLIQCKKFNDEVILLGDTTNKSIALNNGIKYYNHDAYSDTMEWNSFEKCYVHMSSNTAEFEINCFKRFFEIRNFMIRENINRIIYSDSDILTFIDFSKYDVFCKYDNAMCVPNEQDPIRWVANCGVSMWTLDAVSDFIEYVQDIYSNHLDILEKKWNYHCDKKVPGGICDMTLQYLWYKKEDLFNKANLAERNKYFDGVIDFCFKSGENLYRNEYKVDRLTGTKKIQANGDTISFETNEGEAVKACCIHFIGNSKQFMIMVNRKKKIPFAMKLIYGIKRMI